MTNIKNKKTAWIEFTIQAAFLREILHSLNHPPSDLKLFTKGLPQISKHNYQPSFFLNEPMLLKIQILPVS